MELNNFSNINNTKKITKNQIRIQINCSQKSNKNTHIQFVKIDSI